MMLRITSLGRKAQQLLAQSEFGSVWGSTLQGVFLYLPPGMIFLSFEIYRGPLTVNLEGDTQIINNFETGQSVSMRGTSLVFPRLILDWDDAGVWESPQTQGEAIQVEKILERYNEVRRRVASLREPPFPPLHIQVDQLVQGLQTLLGQGSGLTPSGDDVILGCLLTLNRWGHKLLPSVDIQLLSQELVSAAFSRTTLLSANLIACAAEGQADERLLLALDGILTGHLAVDDCAALILSWGDSSGVAAFTGMGIAIKTAQQVLE